MCMGEWMDGNFLSIKIAVTDCLMLGSLGYKLRNQLELGNLDNYYWRRLLSLAHARLCIIVMC